MAVREGAVIGREKGCPLWGYQNPLICIFLHMTSKSPSATISGAALTSSMILITLYVALTNIVDAILNGHEAMFDSLFFVRFTHSSSLGLGAECPPINRLPNAGAAAWVVIDTTWAGLPVWGRGLNTLTSDVPAACLSEMM